MNRGRKRKIIIGIKILIIIFGLLFIIERKPMNIIFNFIGLIITVAILLGEYKTDYLSYLLIIIYCSALTIIFGFVIMLTTFKNIESKYNIYWLLPIIILLTFYSLNSSDTMLEAVSNNYNIQENTILQKIGNIIYQEEINIIRLMIATLILLLSLLALFLIIGK